MYKCCVHNKYSGKLMEDYVNIWRMDVIYHESRKYEMIHDELLLFGLNCDKCEM